MEQVLVDHVDEAAVPEDGGPAEDDQAVVPYETANDRSVAEVQPLASLPPAASLAAVALAVARSGYFPDTRDQAQALVKILYGAELGIAAVSSVVGIYMIDGKPSLSSSIMAAVIAKSGRYRYRVREISNLRCRLEFYEGEELLGSSEFTMDDAKLAGLQGKYNWKNYPRNMLFARALSNGFRWYCPDLLGGAAVYTPEELGIEVLESGEPVSSQPLVSRVAPTEAPASLAGFDDDVQEGVLADEPPPLLDEQT